MLNLTLKCYNQKFKVFENCKLLEIFQSINKNKLKMMWDKKLYNYEINLNKKR